MAKKISKKRKEAFESVVFRANTRASSSYLRQFFLLPPFAKYSGAIMKIFINTRNNNGTEARERRGCCIAGVICLIYGIARSKVRDARQLALRGAVGLGRVQPFSARSAARFGCCSMQTARSFAGRALCTTARIYTRYYCDIVSPSLSLSVSLSPSLSNLCKTKFEITARGRPSSAALAAPRNLFVNFRSNIYSTRLDWKANSRVHGWKIISRPGGCSTA